MNWTIQQANIGRLNKGVSVYSIMKHLHEKDLDNLLEYRQKYLALGDIIKQVNELLLENKKRKEDGNYAFLKSLEWKHKALDYKEKLDDALNQIGFMHKKLAKIENWYARNQGFVTSNAALEMIKILESDD